MEFGWSDYQRGLLGRVVDTLPGLIETAQQLEDAAAHPTNDYHLPTERGVSHLIDLARALSLVARDDEALE